MKLTLIILIFTIITYCSTPPPKEYVRPNNTETKSESTSNDDMVTINKPFQSSQYRSDKNHFRAVSSAESENIITVERAKESLAIALEVRSRILDKIK